MPSPADPVHVHLDELWSQARVAAAAAVSPALLTTPWAALAAVEIGPGHDLGADPVQHGEVVYVLLSGALGAVSREEEGGLGAPAIRVGPARPDPGLRNGGQAPARLLVAAVELPPSRAPRSAASQALDEGVLEWRAAIHGGSGRLATRHLWRPQDFASAWTYVDHAILGPTASVGYHYHDGLEEAFVILSGTGQMTVADRTFHVEAGDLTYQSEGTGHGIYNPGPGRLAFVRLAVAQPGQEATTIDLHDDLRRRAVGGRGPGGGEEGSP